MPDAQMSDQALVAACAVGDRAALGERFRVVTADAEVEVRGTAFDVRAENDHLRAVRVLSGRVEIRAQGAEPKVLDAGERWELTLAHAPTNKEGALARGGADPKPAAATDANPSLAPTARGAAAAPTSTVLGASPAVASPTRVATSPAPSSGSASTTRAASPSSGAASTTRAAAPSSGAASTTRATAPAGGSPARTATSPTSPGTAPGTPSITTNSAGAAPTPLKRPIELLFEQGWAALASGDAPGAAATFERAARSAPSDPLAEDAWFWRASALARARHGDAARALETFLVSYPRSPRAGEASAMLGWLVIDRDADRAEAQFRVAAKDRVAAVRASGEKGLAAVAHRRAQ